MTTELPYKPYDMIMCCLDPVHTGKGGVETGYIDSEILREPGTNLPKISGKAIKGMCRTNAAQVYQVRTNSALLCAGKDNHCGECPVCQTFGTPKQGKETMGTFRFNDAHISLFPVYSYTHGPLWVTTLDRFEMLAGPDFEYSDFLTDTVYALFETHDKISVGKRLFFDVKPATEMISPKLTESFGSCSQINKILKNKKIVVVPGSVFSKIVNENLEIRTSVSIDPLTGTAQDSGLYTYEALPMGTVLISGQAGYLMDTDLKKTFQAFESGWQTPAQVVNQGLALCAVTGLGGMKTPGFGRMNMMLKEIQ